MTAKSSTKPKILYSCYFTRSREGENFIPEHVFSYQISGEMIASDSKNTYHSKEGDFRFSKRNHLAKFVKIPPEGGEFKTISLFLDQEILREVSAEYDFKINKKPDSQAMISLAPNSLYKSFMNSLISYLEIEEENNEALFRLKIKEAIHLLLKVNPELKDILFDFNEPGKIDLEAFMNKNFHFNVHLTRFAYLTGRSLATFKRDFQKVFQETPGKWLLNKRLQEAYYLINQGKSPSEVYIGVGFEDLSHFSFSFKKKFGVVPSSLLSK
ncbi:AraC family transcriptional regulator [Flavobacterium aquidurense]|jgi:AraC-like DNA-binding protein|uniref:helix-turn-helix domain-containing protein n=1 Tax=Flavobacterium aquidurense TaxID=362413 RepID=UPI00091F1EF9|nr:AraC family transcriptional regulator [Flavobacterium aquidurense]OXA72811.1 AraC family transcriptional regulator [Flavobacterium aquidurense]SHG06906.1 AraC-type DNA-binding protein [Flavobacterium frigidimaris]